MKITLFFIVFSLFVSSINSQLTHDVLGSCYGNDKADQYKSLTDIEKAITQLISNASNSYFGNISIGSGLNQFNSLYYCRYDYSLQTCQTCVESAFNILRLSCLPNKQGHRFFEQCTVYYSNNSLNTQMEDMLSSRVARSGGETLTKEETSNFRQILDNTVRNLTNNVVSKFNASSRNFGTIKENYSSTENINAIAQCNPYIAPLNCSVCLENNFDWFMSTYKGDTYAQIFSPICRLSYLLANEELTRPWDFQGYIDQHRIDSQASSSGTRGSSVIGGAMITMISVLVLCLKLLI